MTALSKDEVLAMARKCDLTAGLIPVQSQLERFATLARAPLVAEVERLKADLEHTEGCMTQWATDYGNEVKKNDALIAERDALKVEMERMKAVEPVAYHMLECNVVPRPLAYPLHDYHFAPTEGPLHFTWVDKPHRLLYDLIAAVRHYAKPQPSAVPVVQTLVEALEDILKQYRDIDEHMYMGQVHAAIAAGQKFVKEQSC